jgi:DNA polymerase-1
MGAWGLAQTLKIDKNEAQELLNRYFTVFPSIRTFLNRMSDEAQRNRYAYSPLDGRRRDLSNMDWDHWKKRKHALNIAKNHPIQGASASVTKLALIKIHKYIRTKSKDAGIVAVIHDEILIECHKDIVKEMKKVVENSMIEAFNFYCPDVPMEVDAIIDNHWIH